MTHSIPKKAFADVRAVCIGGGTGVPSSIKALLSLGIRPDAVVSVADDGGSSGLLRSHTGYVPPGDLRKCLVALAKDQQNPWVKAFRERFEYANDHALGNLILTALQQTTGSLTESISLCEELLQTQGHVYPASLESILLMGTTQDGQKLAGQSTLCKSETALADVALTPSDASANEQAIEAILAADILVFGPGSLFTSIIPNILIPGIREAIHRSEASAVFVLPIADIQGETWGLDAFELVDALERHGLAGHLDYVIANKQEAPAHSGNITGYFSTKEVAAHINGTTASTGQEKSTELRMLTIHDTILGEIRSHGIKVLTREMTHASYPSWHDVQGLARALASVIADSKGL